MVYLKRDDIYLKIRCPNELRDYLFSSSSNNSASVL